VSRIGRLPVIVPPGVQVEIKGSFVRVKGPKGELSFVFSPKINITQEENQIIVTRNSDAPDERALHGTTRAVIQNMVTGVSQGFVRVLEWNGVGYRAEVKGKNLVLHMGFSHPIEIEPPAGVEFEVDAKSRQIKVKGYDKQVVGQAAANIRAVRPVEPYHGKGIKYLEEVPRRKAGKAGKGA
jgi:large subunit ribosomal protein L6